MGLVSILKTRIQGKDSEASDSSSTIEFSIDEPTDSERDRAENIQLAVSIALISVYIQVSNGNYSGIFSSGETILSVLSMISVLYLIGKVTAVSLRPIVNWKPLRVVDDIILSVLFMFSFIIGSLLLGWNLALTRYISDIPFTSIVGSLIEFLLIGRFNAMFFFLIVVVSVAYGLKAGNTMSSIQAEAPGKQFRYSSSSGSGEFPITIQNNLSKRLDASEIELAISSPKEVDVEVHGFLEIDGKWRSLVPIEPGGRTQAQLEFSRSDSRNEDEESTVTVSILYRGSIVDTQKIEVVG